LAGSGAKSHSFTEPGCEPVTLAMLAAGALILGSVAASQRAA